MASAQGRILGDVRGKIENGLPHYAFVRNGKQYIACKRKAFDASLMSDSQKVQNVVFRNMSLVSAAIAHVVKGDEKVLEKFPTLQAKVEAVIDIEEVIRAHKMQPNNDGVVKYYTINDFIKGVVYPSLSEKEDEKKAILAAVGQEWVSEDIDGYDLLQVMRGNSAVLTA